MLRLGSNLFILVLALLAGTTAYYATKATVLEKHLARTKTSGVAEATTASSPSTSPSSSTPTASDSPSPAATTTSSSPVAVAAGARLATPAETYQVVAGDTLYPISLKFNMSLERLAEANGLVDPFRLKIGQILMIPEIDAKQKIFEIRFTTDPSRAAAVQSQVAAGQEAWRLDPVAAATAEHGGAFGLATGDDFRLATKSDTNGTATVTATRLVGSLSKTYDIQLTQPATKGTEGVWTLAKIAPRSS